MVPCGTAGALASVFGIFGFSAIRWSGCGLLSLEALVFWMRDLWVISAGFAGGLWVLCIAAGVLVVLLGCLPGRLGRCVCCWSPAVVTGSGIAARRIWLDLNDLHHLICYVPT